MDLKPKDHAEAVAIFRGEIIGALIRRELDRGELRAELMRLSQQAVRPPGSPVTRRYSIPTLERWLYRYKHGGLEALRPRARSDRGRARELTPEQRQLLLDIRREYRNASVPIILRTLVAEGRVERGAISAATVRRLYREHGLDRIALREGAGPKTRLRWQAEKPGALWHTDVCYGPSILCGTERKPVRIHALLDDASRYIVAIEAMHSEREVDMLGLWVRAVRKFGTPDVLYLDNGSTYRGDVLSMACARLGVTLLHAKPHDPEARGKMERFWGTLRRGCLDFCGSLTSLHDLNVRLWAFVDEHYHKAPHSGLMGKSPASVWLEAQRESTGDALDEKKLRDSLTVRERRRVRGDTTVGIDGIDFELDQGFLAGRLVTVAWCMLDSPIAPWVENQGHRYELHRVDAVKNSRRERPPRLPQGQASSPAAPVDFDPNRALLDQALGRTNDSSENKP